MDTSPGGGVVQWFYRNKVRVGTVVAGYAGKRIEEILFDWILYGTVVGWATGVWGPIWGSAVGFLIMTPLSAVMCYLYLRVYDWSKQDWFGFELIKTERDGEPRQGFFMGIAHRIARWGDIPAFIALSIYADPFMVTVYLRKETQKFSGLSRRDWIVFWSSVLVSNGYWTLRWTVLVEIVRFLWSLLG